MRNTVLMQSPQGWLTGVVSCRYLANLGILPKLNPQVLELPELCGQDLELFVTKQS
jgi:hypothetical protein